MKLKPKVTVIMSTYKTPKEYLKSSIESILNQSYNNIEFVIVCDGVIEEYEYIVNKYKDSRIRLIANEKNIGLEKSLNKALDISSGEYIVRMDSDDISLKNRIKTQVKFMEKNKNIVVCGMKAKSFGKGKGMKYIFNKKPKELEIHLLYESCLTHPTIIMRKQFIDENNIRYDEKAKYAEDFELWTRIVNKENITEINKVGLKYRIHNHQVSKDKKSEQKQTKIAILERNAKKLNGNNVLETLLFLNGEKSLELDNLKNALQNVEDLIHDNRMTFKEKVLKKILYNRIFQLVIRRPELIKMMVKENRYRKFIFTWNNMGYLFSKIINNL